MAYNNTNMLRIAQIGAMTRPEYRKMPTLDLGGAVDNFFNARDAADKRVQAQEKKQQMNAYAQALIEAHPEDAARIAFDPVGYAAMLDDNAKAERDQQYKMDYLAKQNANAMGLAAYQNNLRNIAAKEEKAQRAAQLDEALASGKITQEEYDMAQRRELLGDIVNSIPANSPDGTPLTGNKKYDDAYMQEVGKKAAERDIKYKDASDELKIFEDTSKRIEELLPKAAIDTLIQRNMPTMLFDEDTQKARQELRNILGELRLDQMQYLKGAISDKEQAFLSDVVSGDITKYTPNEIRGTINSINRKMKNEVKRYAPQQSVSVDDPLGIL